jgi:hypothetical protein
MTDIYTACGIGSIIGAAIVVKLFKYYTKQFSTNEKFREDYLLVGKKFAWPEIKILERKSNSKDAPLDERVSK